MRDRFPPPVAPAAKGKDGALPSHLHARAAVALFALVIGGAALRAGLPGPGGDPAAAVGGTAASAPPPGAPGDASRAAADDDLVTEAPVPARAIAGLSSGRQLRNQAAQEAQERAARTPATLSSTPPATLVPTTQPPAPTAAPVTSTPATTAPPATAPPTAPPPAPSPPTPAGTGVWDAIAACESGGRWDLDTGSGYYGGLQFLASTWELHGGLAAAPLPHLASRGAQIAVAERVVAAAGGSYRAWGACAARLGLP